MREAYPGSSSSLSSFSGLESAKALGSLISTVSGKQFGGDHIWMNSLAAEISSTNDELSSVFFRYLGMAIRGATPDELAESLIRLDIRWQPVAAEGSALGLSILDQLVQVRPSRWVKFHRTVPGRFTSCLYIGLGMALGLLKPKCQFDKEEGRNLFRWLIIDGMGFARGQLHHLRHKEKYDSQFPFHECDDITHQGVFDQGIGRCLYLNNRDDLARIAYIIGSQDTYRQGDLWSGVGLAAGYVGSIMPQQVDALRRLAGQYAPDLAVGATVACRARLNDGCRLLHFEYMMETLCDLTPEECVEMSEQMMDQLSSDGVTVNGIHYSNYHIWRRRMREFF